jgi:hypothetical protein
LVNCKSGPVQTTSKYFILNCRSGCRPFDWMSAIQPIKRSNPCNICC